MSERPDDGGATASGLTVRRVLSLIATLVLVSGGVLLVNQTLQLAEFAGRLHPVAGDAVFWGLVFTYLFCAGVPLYLFLPAAPAARTTGVDRGPRLRSASATARPAARREPARDGAQLRDAGRDRVRPRRAG